VPELCERGYEVHAVNRRPPASKAADVVYHSADLLDPQQTEELVSAVRPDFLLHLAWCTEHGRFWTSPDNYRWVASSLRLAESFHANGGRRIVVAGTCAEYDWGTGKCDELITPLRPHSDYGLCKNALLQLLEGYSRRVGMSFAWGRLFHLYGPNENPSRFVSSIIVSLLRGEKARGTKGLQQRDFLYVKDVADAFVTILQSEWEGAINLGTGHAYTLSEIAQRIANKLNREELLELGAIPTQPDDPLVLLPSIDRLRNDLGWRPSYDLNAGLEETIEWWQSKLQRSGDTDR
jgi:nucleoside-diphosphate-sugar epimerase